MKRVDYYKCFLLYIKTSKTYYQRYIDVILDRANKYYENDKEILREQAKNKCRKLFEVQNNIKRKYGSNKYHMCEDKKNIYIKKSIVKLIEVKNLIFIDLIMCATFFWCFFVFYVCFLYIIKSVIFMSSRKTNGEKQ